MTTNPSNIEQELEQLKAESLDYLETSLKQIEDLNRKIASLESDLSKANTKIASLEAERLVQIKQASEHKIEQQQQNFITDDEARDLLNVLTTNGFIKKSNINANIDILKTNPRAYYGLMLKMAESISAPSEPVVSAPIEQGYACSNSKSASESKSDSNFITQEDVIKQNQIREEQFMASMRKAASSSEDPFKTFLNQF
jgi:predicted RND superfamily exporter protein